MLLAAMRAGRREPERGAGPGRAGRGGTGPDLGPCPEALPRRIVRIVRVVRVGGARRHVARLVLERGAKREPLASLSAPGLRGESPPPAFRGATPAV